MDSRNLKSLLKKRKFIYKANILKEEMSKKKEEVDKIQILFKKNFQEFKNLITCNLDQYEKKCSEHIFTALFLPTIELEPTFDLLKKALVNSTFSAEDISLICEKYNPHNYTYTIY